MHPTHPPAYRPGVPCKSQGVEKGWDCSEGTLTFRKKNAQLITIGLQVGFLGLTKCYSFMFRPSRVDCLFPVSLVWFPR